MITQTGEYALRAIVHLAARPERGPATAQDIASATQVPVGYLQKILRMLAKARILSAQRGSGGGFALAKVPTAISVMDILLAVDARPVRIERCPLGLDGHARLCALHRLLDEQIANAERAFAVTSVADLASGLVDGEVGPLCDAPSPRRRSARPGSSGSSGSR